MRSIIPTHQSFPLTRNYPSLVKRGVRVKTVEKHLLGNVYVRFSNIYLNLLENISIHPDPYLQLTMSPKLFDHISYRRKLILAQGYKIRMNEPTTKFFDLNRGMGNKTKWNNLQCKIAFDFNVYFGKNFQSDAADQLLPGEKSFSFGKHRTAVFSSERSMKQNLKSLWTDRFYEFRVQVESTRFLQIYDVTEPRQTSPETVTSEMTLRCSNANFNWMIMDINGLMA